MTTSPQINRDNLIIQDYFPTIEVVDKHKKRYNTNLNSNKKNQTLYN